tara:strand:+ start:543 stop:779 length:237 start_codon:yes stop_codon:yes gene_type:complete
MKNDMQYINVEGSNGLVRDQNTGAVLNTNSNEIAMAKKRKMLFKEKSEEFKTMKEDIRNLKEDIGEMKSLLTKIADGW